jgi:hypothetical protein
MTGSIVLAHRAFASLAIIRAFPRLDLSGSASSETAYVLGWPVGRKHTGANHFSKEVDIVVNFARHLFANSVKDLQEFWLSVHDGFDYFDNL